MTTTGTTGFEERRKALQERLRALNIHLHGGDPRDNEIEQVESLLDNSPTDEARKQAVSDWLRDRFEADYNNNVRAVNDVLLPLGRCISPAFMPGVAFTEVHRFCIAISSALTAGNDVSGDVTRVVELIAKHYFAPHIRAFMIVRAKRLPYLELISHYLDDAAMAFYRRDYFACANALTTAVERLLLEHVGWKFGMKDMHHPDIRAAIYALAPAFGDKHFDVRFETYKQYVLEFLTAYQTPSRKADLSVSRFNRAFIQHVNDSTSYYTYDDCVTAFQFFDLYVEFVAAQTGKELHAFVPENDAEIDLRTRHYWRTILEGFLHGIAPSVERAILESNPHFQKEAADSNYLSLFAPGPEQNRAIGSAFMTLGLRNVSELASLVHDPVDPDRLGLVVKLLFSFSAIMGMDTSKDSTIKPSSSSDPS